MVEVKKEQEELLSSYREERFPQISEKVKILNSAQDKIFPPLLEKLKNRAISDYYLESFFKREESVREESQKKAVLTVGAELQSRGKMNIIFLKSIVVFVYMLVNLIFKNPLLLMVSTSLAFVSLGISEHYAKKTKDINDTMHELMESATKRVNVGELFMMYYVKIIELGIEEGVPLELIPVFNNRFKEMATNLEKSLQEEYRGISVVPSDINEWTVKIKEEEEA